MKKLLSSLLWVLCCFTLSAQQVATDSTKSIHIGNTVYIKSIILKEERALNIYLPDGYNPKDTVKYPVVYLLDGSTDEDFLNVVGLYYFNGFPWVNRTPKSIIVGIANTDRKRDFTYPTSIKEDKASYPSTGGSSNFIWFIANELQPYIEKNYKTTTDRTIIGESLGGLLATEILFKHTALFRQYIIISPSLWWDNGSILQDTLLNNIKQYTRVYIGIGKEGLSPGKIPHVGEVDANILADKLKRLNYENLKIYFDYLSEENHATISEHALFNALNQK
jgi:predicted alpha/beta superfamily hydrolase